mmetsp:Transcript_11718/g.17099  ORF Transcript_11718/g.17099 Transcript_11718/m.17099 type:complete len:406 (-) Transcript_11718:234-1451(-)
MTRFSIAALILASFTTASTTAFTSSSFPLPTLNKARTTNSRNIHAFQPLDSLRVPSISIHKISEGASPNRKSRICLHASSSNAKAESKCPVTKFGNRITANLSKLDNYLLNRIIRIANHIPAILSLSYFGLISMASMMNMGPMAATASAAKATAKAATTNTLSSLLTQTVGMTTNQAFASYFPTLVTPAPFVFLVWPLIAILQSINLTVSALFPSQDEILSQSDLSALTLANLAATMWLLTSSNATPGHLPLASFLVLPLVPMFSGYLLRNKPKYILWAYQVYSSFTTLASILAFTVEIQHGGRIPFIGTVGKEVAACVFLSLYSMVSLAVGAKSGARRVVNFGAISGILWRRVSAVLGGVGVGVGGLVSGLGSLLLSVSFLGTVGCWFWSLKDLFSGNGSGSTS